MFFVVFSFYSSKFGFFRSVSCFSSVEWYLVSKSGLGTLFIYERRFGPFITPPLTPPRGGGTPPKRGVWGSVWGGIHPPFFRWVSWQFWPPKSTLRGGLSTCFFVGGSILDRKRGFWSSNFDDFWKKRGSYKNGKSFVLGSENSFLGSFLNFR